MFEDAKKSNNDGVIRSETLLTDGYIPEEFVGREEEIDRIADAIKPIARRHNPDNLLIHGPAGTGKTVCVKHVTQRLEEEASIKVVHINCWQYNTRPSLLVELLIQLGYPAPRKGKPNDELLAKIGEWLDKNRGVAVVLDEFDRLDNQTEIIYDLQMLNEDTDHALGIIMISNQHPTRIDLDPRSQSRLNCQTLQFEPYTHKQLSEILERRVQRAFNRPKSVPETVIETVAEHAAEHNGDCRKALQTLLKAARKADREGKSNLDVQDIP